METKPNPNFISTSTRALKIFQEREEKIIRNDEWPYFQWLIFNLYLHLNRTTIFLNEKNFSNQVTPN